MLTTFATSSAEATRITNFVDELEAEAGRLGDAAVEAAAASAAAEAARAAAEGRAGQLRTAADAGDKAAATAALQTASKALDKAASKGIIHKNQAANRKSALAKKVAGL